RGSAPPAKRRPSPPARNVSGRTAELMANAFYRGLGRLLGSSQRSDPFPQVPFGQWLSEFIYNGSAYPFAINQSIQGNKENIPHDFVSYTAAMYKSNGAVFAVELSR